MGEALARALAKVLVRTLARALAIALASALARAGFSVAVRNLRFVWQRVGAQRAGEPRFTCEVGFENGARQCASAYTRQESITCACHPQSGRAYRDTISLPCYPAGGGTEKINKTKKCLNMFG